MRSTIALMMLMTAVAAPAQERAPDKTPAATKMAMSHQEAMIADAEDAWVKPPVDEAAAVSHGAVTVEGQRIAYTATAGTLTIRDKDGKPTGSMFYTA
jgi:carboxypeptidase C (cathepsin A)